MTIALVTGATAGIGAEFSRQLAARGHDLVLVARDRERLDAFAAELAGRHGVAVEVLAADLLDREQLAIVEQRVSSPEHPIDLLLNNAGYGLPGWFEENSRQDETDLLEILAMVPMRLTHAALQQMLPRRSGTIVNIASVAGFTPRGTYGAAKAWVISFSRWANLRYKPMGVSVTAVAPGFVRTEFHERMGTAREAMAPRWMWLDAEPFVRAALRDVDRGKAVSVPTLRYKLIVGLVRWAPSRLAAAYGHRGRAK
jgi:short-subunit dehydrogenase